MPQTDAPPRLPRARAGIDDIPRLPPGLSAPAPEGAILLDTNENRFGASPAVAEAIARDLAEGRIACYPPVEALPLNRALAARHGLGPACVVSAGGAELLLPLAILAFAGPGDEVVYFADGFSKFRAYILTSGATPVDVPRAEDAVAALLARITPKTRVVLFDNPGNPTGRMLPADDIARLHAALPSDVLLMLDEAYIEFADTPRLGLDYVPAAGNVLVFRTLSKAYGLAGLRVGWAAGAEPLVEAVRRVIPSFPISRPTLAGALAALADEAHLNEVVAQCRAGRDAATARFRAAGWKVAPSQGNFVLVQAGAPGTDVLAATERLRARNIFVRALPSFLGQPAMRVTIGTPEDMESLFQTIGA